MDWIKRIPAWLMALALVSIFILMVFSLNSGKVFGYRLQDHQLFVGFFGASEPNNPNSVETWYGYYRDLDDQGGTVTTSEQLALSFYDNGAIRGISKGPVIRAGRTENVEWKVDGFEIGKYVALTYMTNKAHAPGVGAYVLEAVAHAEYVGHWEGVDDKSTAIISCPYVLSRDQLSVAQAESRWAHALKGDCIHVHLAGEK